MTRGGISAWGQSPDPDLRSPPGVRGCAEQGHRDVRWDTGKGTGAEPPWLGWVELSEVLPKSARSPVRPCPVHLRISASIPGDAQPRLCPAAGGMSTRALPGPGWGHRPGDVGCRPPSTPCSSPGCAGSHLLLHAHNALRLLLIPLQRWGRGDRGARGLLQGSAGLWGRGDLGVLCPPQLCNHSKV